MGNDIFKHTLAAYSMESPEMPELVRPAISAGSFEKQFEKTRSAVKSLLVVSLVCGVGAVGTLAWVAVHFLRKFW